MGGLFSTLSKQLLGNFLYSTGLPAVAFVLGFQALIAPHLPETWHILENTEALEAEWKAAFAVLAVAGMATALAALNGPIIRLYEGYPLRGSWIGRRMVRKHRRKAEEAELWLDGTRSILRGLRRLKQINPETAGAIRVEGGRELRQRWQRVRQQQVRIYPASARVLPTRLGNVIRAYEDYPKEKYGMYGVTLWPRLSAVIEDSYAQQIEEAKQPFDLLMNFSLVSVLLSGITLLCGLVWPARWLPNVTAGVTWAITVAALLALGRAWYLMALPRAAVWGDTVKSAYDLYRRELLKKLGFTRAPAHAEEEEKLWRQIGGHMLFGRLSTSPNLTYAGKPNDPEKAPRWLRAVRELVS